jgi:hypothetical protein
MTETRLSRGTIGSFQTTVLENRYVRAVVIPELGGRIWQLEDKTRKREWIWHRPGTELVKTPVGAVYDDVWAGGWEELFPNDAPGPFEGRHLPDHGEWWTLAWDVHDATESALELTSQCSVVKAMCSKQIRLDSREPRISVTYRIASLEERPFHFLFKQHLPVRLNPACRLVLPGGRVLAVDRSFSTLLSGQEPADWPYAPGVAGSKVDLRVVRDSDSGDREFVYVMDLPEPWCGVDDVECGASLKMSFESTAFPYVWLFLSYGGWRSTYTAVLEPCTNIPKDLGEAKRHGRAARLAPGEEFVTTVSVDLSGCP